LTLPVLLKKHPAQKHRTDRHSAVGDIEGPESDVADADVDEVHDAARRANAIDEVSGRTAPRQSERQRLESLVRRASPIESPEDDESDERERAEDQARRRPEGHAERRARI